MRSLMFGLAALTLGAEPAAAVWQKVGSPHFIIYADAPPDKSGAFASR